MLLRALFLLLLLGALAETTMSGAHALARASLRRQAEIAVRQELDSAETAARETIAAALADGADPQSPAPVAPSIAPSCRLAEAAGCAIQGTATVAFGAAVGGGYYVQGNDAVSEGRIEATLAARAVAPNGDVLAARNAVVVYRTLGVPPYAVPAGNADATGAQLGGAPPGNDGGAAPYGAAPGTLIDVLYENRTTGAAMPGNVWHFQAPGSASNPGSWSP